LLQLRSPRTGPFRFPQQDVRHGIGKRELDARRLEVRALLIWNPVAISIVHVDHAEPRQERRRAEPWIAPRSAMAEIYRRKVGDLAAALIAPDCRDEAAAILRGLRGVRDPAAGELPNQFRGSRPSATA
jgi:hypothetical protein